MPRIKRVRDAATDYAAEVSPIGFITSFTADPTKAGQFAEDTCLLVLSNYAWAGVTLTLESVSEIRKPLQQGRRPNKIG